MNHGFFTSYARANNRNNQLRRVVDQIAARVADRLGRADQIGICFFDEHDVEVGAEWESHIADAVNGAQVLICLTSPVYFRRPACAKEFEVFRRRLEASAASGPFVLPVIWEVPHDTTPIPRAISRLQNRDDSLPKKYWEGGLSKLSLQSKKVQAETIDALADKIVQAICHDPQLSSLPLRPRFDDLPNSFHDPSEHRDGVAVIVVHEEGASLDLRVSQKPTQIQDALDAAARSCGLGWRELPISNAFEDEVNRLSPSEALVVIAPRGDGAWTAGHTRIAGLAAGRVTGAIVPANFDPQSFGWQAAGRCFEFRPELPETLRASLERLFTDLKVAASRRSVQPAAVVDPERSADAREAGLPNLTRRPQLSLDGTPR